MTPETTYTNSGGVSIAYQVLGEGALDWSWCQVGCRISRPTWEDPDRDDFFRRLLGFSRLILFDKRGTGLSDRVAELPSLEVRMDDVRAVLDAVGSQRAAFCRLVGRRADVRAVRGDLSAAHIRVDHGSVRIRA